MTTVVSKAVLITGCSTGIGRASALRLARNHWTVYATARRLESIEDLATQGCRLMSLDVTDTESMRTAVKTIEDAEGCVGVVVNNAGYGLHGAVETTPLDEARSQFDTNFFGLLELTQMVLPGMRAQGWGRVVNVSSMGGRFTFPGGGLYHASKHALEALSDALRFEVAPWGIDVVVIEPGLVKTRFGDTAIGTVGNETTGDPYLAFNAGVMAKIEGAYRGPLGRAAVSPEKIAVTIERAVEAKRPKTRYITPLNARLLLMLKRVLPDRAFDALLKTQYTPPQP